MTIISLVFSLLFGWLKSGLSWLFKNPYVLLGLAVAVVIVFLCWHNASQDKTITTQATQITTLKGTVKSDKAVIQETKDEGKRAVIHDTIKDHILNAPLADIQTEDGSIPPVLLHTFDSLRNAHSGSR